MANSLSFELKRFQDSLLDAMYHNVDVSEKPKNEIRLSISKKKGQFSASAIHSSKENINKNVWALTKLHTVENNKPVIIELMNLVHELNQEFNKKNYMNSLEIIQKIKLEQKKLIIPESENNKMTIDRPKLNPEIAQEVLADIEELENAYNASCYRSCIILCGRILETCLHRKYYDVTGFDILEKNPGIGLGTLIAKMQEKDIKLDPGITQQIHLINNVRIFSVHKKRDLFIPTRQQTYAIILFTLDIVSKMF
ncbi:hypothetical protein J4468_00810 [Candidatus Woesearchaeota archaeon]|nr:hypothetical protein [Candidatus Woesearchaeota archaeon]